MEQLKTQVPAGAQTTCRRMRGKKRKVEDEIRDSFSEKMDTAKSKRLPLNIMRSSCMTPYRMCRRI